MFSKFFIATGLIIAFIGWASYHFFIQKNLKQSLNEFFFGLFFIGVWMTIIWLILR